MATSHAQPLLLFFVSVFFLPAALGTAIEVVNCHEEIMYNSRTVNITKVDITPYPIKFQDKPIFKITGVTDRSLDWSPLSMYFIKRGSFPGWVNHRNNICDVTKCPIKPGPLELTIDNVNNTWGDHLSGSYTVELRLRNLPTEAMCARFKFHASDLAEIMNIPRPSGASVSKVDIFPFNVTVNDNPVFLITAYTPKNISSSSTVSARMILEGSKELFPRYSRFGYKLCDCTKHCPIVPGTFELAIPHPYWKYELEAGRYRVDLQIINQKYPFHASMSVRFWFRVSEA